MPIAHVVPTPFGRSGLLGGGERYPFELCRALARYLPCRLITFDDRSHRQRDKDLEIIQLATIVRLKGHPAHPLARGLFPALRDVELIHTHHTRSFPSRCAALIAQATGIPVVTTDHGLGGGGWGGLLPRLFDGWLGVSQHSLDVLRPPPSKSRVILGGVDHSRFKPGSDERNGVLFVGRLTPHKGVDVLIGAMPPGVTLTIAGTAGHDRREPERSYPAFLRDRASAETIFTGPVPEEELPQLYRRAEIFVLPSVHRTVYGKSIVISELLGLSVLEAMSSGTPVIASRIGGLPEVVRDGVTGYLVTPGDTDELANRIRELTGDPAKARRMGNAGRKLVLERFTWDHCAQRCLAAYRELTGLVV